jgi:hypothetical protein
MDKSVVSMLGLFTVPPAVKIKDKEERALEAQLLNAHRDFFQGAGALPEAEATAPGDNMFVDSKDAKRMRELER